MAIQVGQGVIPIQADFSQFQRQLDTGLAGASKKMQVTGRGIFRSGAVITAGLTTPIALGFKSAIDGASDLAETVSKARTIFGPAGDDLEAWADNSATAIGQSKQQALDAAGTFGNLFTQLDIGSDQALKMSTQMVELASDFASFHNANPEDIINAQTAAFRGEYDALQRYVPTINAAAVEQKALATTGKKTTKQLTLQEKAIAVQQLMLEGAGEAMGDFERTSDGAANKQRILKAQMADAAATLGKQLLPFVTKLLGWVQKAVKWFSKLGQPMQGIVLAGAALLAVIGPLVGIIGALVTVAGVLISPIALVVIGIAALVAGVIIAYNRFEGFREVVQAVVDFFMRTVVPAIRDFARYIADQFGSLVDWVREHWDAISEAIGHVVAVIWAVIDQFISGVKAAWSLWGDDLLRVAGAVFSQIQNVVKTAVDLVRGIIETVLALINGDWGAAWDGIKGIVSTAWEFITTTISNAIDGILGILGGVGDTIATIADGMWDGIWDAFKGVLNLIIDGWNSLEFKIPGFDPPGPGPKFGGFTLGVPDIPRLHSGGRFNAPRGATEGLALLSDGEQVLSPFQSRRYDQILRDMTDDAMGGGSTTVNLYYPERENEEHGVLRALRHLAAS